MVKTITIDGKTYTLTPVEDNEREEDRAEVFAKSVGLCQINRGSTPTATEKNLRKKKKLRYEVGDEVFVNWHSGGQWEKIMKVIDGVKYYAHSTSTPFFDDKIDNEKTALGKPKEVKSWEDLEDKRGWIWDSVQGKAIQHTATVVPVRSTKEQAEAEHAMKRLSQLMKNVNGDWKPDRNERKTKYIIYIRLGVVDVGDNGICGQSVFYGKRFLSFPTREIRDTFLENHRELIEKCKPLL